MKVSFALGGKIKLTILLLINSSSYLTKEWKQKSITTERNMLWETVHKQLGKTV